MASISLLITLPSRGISVKAAQRPPLIRSSVIHQAEVIKSLEGWARDRMLPYLKPVEESWQPQEFLPDPTRPFNEFTEEVRALRERSAQLSDDYLVVLVGDMITEDAVPTYQSLFNLHHGFQPDSAADPSPWTTWTRRWTAEENRHGDLLRSYLYLSGRVDMVMVERTLHHLIGSGMESKTDKYPYYFVVYTSFQERATAISHGNTARLAKQQGDDLLARICGSIAADEKRHERAYTAVVGKLLEVDPTGAMLAIGDMMKRNITMPAHLMTDGHDPHLFHHFSAVAQRLGVYTTSDYADILEHLIQTWRLESVEGLTPEGRAAQEYVCRLPPRIRSLHDRAQHRAQKLGPTGFRFSWIFNKEVSLS